MGMPRRPVSRDLKVCILILRHEQGLSVKTICQLLGVKKSLVYQTLIYSRAYGVLFNPHSHCSGQCRKLLPTDLDA
jgi:transposase